MKHNTTYKKRITALFLAVLIMFETIAPNVSYALSGGPSQPEVEGFTAAGTTDMVDLFTGDFNYNIPLMDVDGYPINIGYQSGVSMDQEASWVGLGWNLNPGAINRSMRGIPDDFNGDEIQRKVHIKPSCTIGLTGSIQAKLFGFKISKVTDKKSKYMNVSVGLNAELFYNNYNGLGFSLSPDWDVSLTKEKQAGYPPNPKTPEPDTTKKVPVTTLLNKAGKEAKVLGSQRLAKLFNVMYKSALAQIPGVGLIYSRADLKKLSARNITQSIREIGRQGTSATNLISAYFPNGSGYLPKLSNKMQTLDFRFKMKFGLAANAIFGSPEVGVYCNWEGTDGETFNKKAYGALYYNNKNNASHDILLDFNRDHEGAYTKDKPVLPMPVNMYDIYSISGQGVGGMFRAMRNGITLYHDDVSESTSNGTEGSMEFGATTDVHTKYNLTQSYNNVYNGKWENDFTARINDNSSIANEQNYETNYFKLSGEKGAVNNKLVYNKNTNIPYKPKLDRVNLFSIQARTDLVTDNDLLPAEQLTSSFGGTLYASERAIRNQFISVITYGNKKAFQEPVFIPASYKKSPQFLDDINNNTESYSNSHTVIVPNSLGIEANSFPAAVDINTNETAIRKPHHIGEITLNQTNGSRYIYGVAAYNNEQTEYTVNIGKVFVQGADAPPGIVTGLPILNTQTNIVKMNTTVESYINNGKGYGINDNEDDKSDQYFNRVKTPGFAHAYLLSSILHADYVDIAPKGTGPEDLGNYTKFNYTRTSKEYRWRTPAVAGSGTFIDGLKSQSHDNKMSIVEGTKELWYLQTIESKNHVALFIIEPRADARAIVHGLGANAIGADVPDNTNAANYSFRLKRIILYTRDEYEKYASNSYNLLTAAMPIKTVWFNYDYSLCPGIKNSWTNEGKLTLKSIYFTYGQSTKKISTYKFDYSAVNPSYNQSNVDRWGNYKPQISGGPNNIDFPYVRQNKTEADANASAWLLNKIKLPSGGIININYESDDYAYVQNKPAAQMMKIEGMHDNANFPTQDQNVLYEEDGEKKNNFLFFKIPSSVYQGMSDAAEAKQARENYMYQCIYDVKDMAFKVLMDIRGSTDKEWVTGYASPKAFGLCNNNNNNDGLYNGEAYFYVELKNLDLESMFGSRVLHPLTKAGFNFAKTNLPFIVNPTSFDGLGKSNASVETYAYKLLGIGSLITTLFGVNDRLLSDGYCKKIDLSQSYCRLNEPFSKKLGGGVRVKKITISDEWAELTKKELATDPPRGNSEEYGQEFDYTTQEFTMGRDRKISSGVAAYEPSAGAEENPFRQPIGFTKSNFLSPNEDQMVEGPIGESFYPSPTVGYARVTVTNIGRQNGSNRVHGIGKTVNQFFTARDFPTIVSHTAITDMNVRPPLLDFLVYKGSFEDKYVSQGFAVECNDMHGKVKSVEVFKEESPGATLPKPITGTYYTYKTSAANKNKLDNSNISVINSSGATTSATMGVETEMYADNRKSINQTYAGGIHIGYTTLNFYALVLPFFPIYPTFEDASNEFYSTTLNRVTTTYGIIEKVRVVQDASEITTENIAFDALTGETLITRTTNEFKQNVYNTTYPAHWMYNFMGPGYKNVGIGFSNISTNTFIPPGAPGGTLDPYLKVLNSALSTPYLNHGDEVLINGTTMAFVEKISSSKYYLYKLGTNDPIYLSNSTLTVIRSGSRNMQSSPIFSATTLNHPINNTGSIALDKTSNVLNANAVLYKTDQSHYQSIQEKVDSNYFLLEHLSALRRIFAWDAIQFSDFVLTADVSTHKSYELSKILNSNTINDHLYINTFVSKLRGSNLPHNIVIRGNQVKSPSVERLSISIALPLQLSTTQEYDCNVQFYLPPQYSLNNTTFHSNYKLTNIALLQKPIIPLYENGYMFSCGGYVTFTEVGTLTPDIVYIPVDLYFKSYLAPSVTPSLQNSSYQHNASVPLTQKYLLVKPEGNLLYKEDRNNNHGATEPLFANTKGTYKKFDNVFNLNSKAIVDYTQATSKWKLAEKSTLFDPYTGTEVESKDALDRYRSIVYYKDQFIRDNMQYIINNQHYGISSKPQLYIENGRQREATVFNFESENELRTFLGTNDKFTLTDRHYFEKIPDTDGLPSKSSTVTLNNASTDANSAHTGKGSLKLLPGSAISANFLIPYINTTPENAILPFYPTTNKKYIISGWFKSNKPFFELSNTLAKCSVEVKNARSGGGSAASNYYVLEAKGPIINGWQQFYGEFTIVGSYTDNTSGLAITYYPTVLKLTMENNETTSAVYVDDIRIQPFDANVKNYLYNEQHKVKTILDENNYATFYHYNERGELVTISRETEKGIVNIKENRKSNPNE